MTILNLADIEAAKKRPAVFHDFSFMKKRDRKSKNTGIKSFKPTIYVAKITIGESQ